MLDFRYDVPPPTILFRRGRPALYPWAEIPMGASVFVKGEQKRVRAALRQYRHRHPKAEFAWKRERGGVRVWRLRSEDRVQPAPSLHFQTDVAPPEFSTKHPLRIGEEDYPWRNMAPGDTECVVGKAPNIRGSIQYWQSTHPGQKFATRAALNGLWVRRTA